MNITVALGFPIYFVDFHRYRNINNVDIINTIEAYLYLSLKKTATILITKLILFGAVGNHIECRLFIASKHSVLILNTMLLVALLSLLTVSYIS